MPSESPNTSLLPRIWIIGLACLCLLLFLVSRLWVLQVREHDQLNQDIRRQSIRRIREEPVRGRMISADGTILVDNRPAYNIVFHLAEMRQPGTRRHTLDFIEKELALVGDAIGRPVPLDRAQILKHIEQTPAQPLPVFEDLTPPEMAKAYDLYPPVLGLEIHASVLRTYPHPGVATHVLGFTGRRQPDDEVPVDNAPRLAYSSPELAGRNGLERIYDSDLSGHPGERLVQVDILGYIHDEIAHPQAAQDGCDLLLTLNANAQRAAELVLHGRHGALVCLDVHTGGVIAMASAPDYDLSTLNSKRYSELRTDLGQPLFNRALSGSYIPGSIIKPLTGLAALESGKVRAGDIVTCTGSYPVGNRPIRCWERAGHGPLTITGALEHSCNGFFIDAVLKMSPTEFLTVLHGAGLGQTPEIDLPGAASGTLPDMAKATAMSRGAWISDAAFLSIGQGPIAITPLQAAMFTAAIANGGTVFRPHIVAAVRNADGTMRSVTAPLAQHRIPVRQSVFTVIRQGMWQAVHNPMATARHGATDLISLAGKTGTAQVQTRDGIIKNTWFVGYAPSDKPDYAFAVVLEQGESGGQTAPLIKQFFELWLTPGALEKAEAEAKNQPLPSAPLPPDEAEPPMETEPPAEAVPAAAVG